MSYYCNRCLCSTWKEFIYHSTNLQMFSSNETTVYKPKYNRRTDKDLERGGAEDRQTLALHYQQFEGGCRTLGQFLPASFLLLWFSRNSRRGVCVCRCVMTLKVCVCLQAQRCRVEQSRGRKARICSAAGTKSERVRERVTNRRREREREWDRSIFLYVWGCCQHAAGYWSKTISCDV